MDNGAHYKAKFSVIIPVYNRGKMITEAIESVLSQSFCDFELIVVDDGSVDETPKVLELYRDRAQIITQRNSGPEIGAITILNPKPTSPCVPCWHSGRQQTEAEWISSFVNPA